MAKNTRNAYGFGQGSPLPSMSPLPILALRNPLASDLNFEIGTNWINTTNNRIWILASTAANVATWTDVSGTVLPEIETLTPDSGGAVGPDGVNHNVNIVGGTGITTVGTPGTNTLTLNASAGEASITKYVVDGDGSADFTTIQAAITAANTAALPAMVYVRSGTYTEDLTLFDAISIRGDGLETVITGVHTPPAAGNIYFSELTMTSATDIVTSAAAGTAGILFFNCAFNCTNGYIVDCANWTGPINFIKCADTSAINGIVNNQGVAAVNLWSSILGAGATNIAKTGGSINLFSSRVVIPITLAGATTFTAIMGSSFSGTLTSGGSSTVQITNSNFTTGATASIVQSSSGLLQLTNVTIDTSNNPAIDGAGAGDVYLSGVEFLDGSNLAATLTLNSGPETRTTKVLAGDSTYRVNAFNLDSNIIQAYSDDVTPTGASTLSAIQGNQVVTAGDGNHTPNGIFGSITAESGSDMLQALGVYGYANQADGSAITSTFVGVEGQCDIDETDAADLPQIFAFGTKGFLTGEDAGGVPATGEFAGVGSVVGYNTPFNGYVYGVCSTRLGGGAGTAGRAAFGVAQGTQAIPDWLYGLDLFNTTPGNSGQAYTTADVRMQNESTIAVQAEGVTFSGDASVRAIKHTNTDITFNANPVLQSNANTGAAPSGATGATNIMTCQDGMVKEEFIQGAGQTIIAPRMENDGLLISLDLAFTEGAEYNYGVFTSAKHQFLIGTSPAFFYEVSFKAADVSGCEPLFMGFRSVEANNASFVGYNDLAGLGIITSQNADLITQAVTIGGGGATYTNTQDAWTDGQTHTLRVNVTTAGVATYLIDGVAPTIFSPYTFNGAVSVMPYISLLHAAVAPGAIHQITERCGFQDWN